MYYYEVAILKSPLDPLTYQSKKQLTIGTKVLVTLQRMINLQDGVIIKEVEKPAFNCIDVKEITEYFYSEQMLISANFISQYYVCSIGEALSIYTPFYDIEKQNNSESHISDIQLSTKQNEAYEFTLQNPTSLLFANTGSGKTEIYIKAIENTLSKNKQALLLLPEISLSPQMEQRLQKVFKDSIAIWHSKIQKRKKQSIVEGLLNGKIKVIAGARSALFLPFSELGLIVVDEEHDDSYKADQKPRLNTKDLAIYMGKKFDIQVILGSATPSLSSFYKIPYYRLKQTYFESKKDITFINSNLGLDETIINKIQQTTKNNNQVIVFLPTRANFKYQICSSCGSSIECPFCSVSLSLHKNKNALCCHYCNYTEQIRQKCPKCGGTIENFRLGTAEVVQELSKRFKDKKVTKFDRDAIKTQTELKKIIKEFNNNEIDILVGTQMLSKGHDYHNVKLAVILGIDSILNMNSYKVRERALSLLIQIAGRSGRKGLGEVVVQTKNEEFFSNYILNNDYEEFLQDELQQRKELYPPYKRLARITFSHKNATIAKKELDIAVQKSINFTDIEVIGFGESGIFKIANKYRYELLIRSTKTNKLLSLLHSFKSPLTAIDMDTLH
jgi:primosomal protein N' (replication factor Y) (superfamily II helicase)